MNFPTFKSKNPEITKKFDLTDSAGRRDYFTAKAGPKIEKIKEYLDQGNTFVAFLLAKKGSGKGTFAKLFTEIIGPERVGHLSVGDMVRSIHPILEGDSAEKTELLEYLNNNYRGYIPVEEAVKALLGRSTTAPLIPTEFILALVKREIEKMGRKAIFIDGFPRNLDQVSYSLYFRQIMNMRDDPDFFVLFHAPESVLDARVKTRAVCPICQNSRNLALNPTKFVGFDEATKEYFLMCDNKDCSGFGKERMGPKEGDSLGIEAIRDRLEMDQQVIDKAFTLQGVPKIYLNNAVPVSKAKELLDDYEITPEFSYYKKEDGTIGTKESSWVVKDDDGTDSVSIMPAVIVLSLISQIYDLLFS